MIARSPNFIVYCAGTPWDGVRGTDRHIAEQISHAQPVLWVDPPRSVARAGRGTFPGTSTMEVVRTASVYRLSVTTPPFPTRPGGRVVATWLMRRSIAKAVRQLHAPVDAMIVARPESLFSALPNAAHIYFGTDDFLAGAALTGTSERWMAASERRQLAGADLAVAVSKTLADRWGPQTRRVVTVPNGCAVEAYDQIDEAPVPTDIRLRQPIAGMVGQISSRIDLRLLEAVVDSGISLLLIGPVDPTFRRQGFDHLATHPLVQWLGPRPFEALPSYMKIMRVGLTPYADSAFNRASFPLKTLEYLAAGVSVVSTPMPAVEWLDCRHIRTADSPRAFAAAVSRLATSTASSDERDAMRRFAANHSWQERAARLLSEIGDVQRIAGQSPFPARGLGHAMRPPH